MKTSIFSKKALDYKLIEPWIIEEEKKREEEEERRKHQNGSFIPLYAPSPDGTHLEEPEEEEKPKRVIIIDYD